MTLPPIDFSPLEPPDGESRWERLARRIDAAAAPELAARATLAASPWRRLLVRRAWPLLAAAATVALLAGGALRWQQRRQVDPATELLAGLVGVSYQSAAAFTAGGRGLEQPLALPAEM